MGPTSRFRLAALAAAFLGLACSRQPTSPAQASFQSPAVAPAQSQAVAPAVTAARSTDAFVDLALGRVTRVEGRVRTRSTPFGQAPGDWTETPLAFVHTITGEETHGGLVYRVDQMVDPAHPETVFGPDRWREDRSGLFDWQEDLGGTSLKALAHASTTDAAIARAWRVIDARRNAALGRAPTRLVSRRGPQAGEITFLRYPLHPNLTWEGRPGFNVYAFEGWDDLDTPAGTFRAARLRIDVPGQLGPNDVVETWWAAPGEVQRHFHFVADLTDANGVPTGTFEADETLLVTAYTP